MPKFKIDKKSGKVTKVTSRTSKSGKYKSMRHLMEVLFSKDQKITEEEVVEVVLKEYPKSKFVSEDGSHFPWYRTKIVSNKEFKTIDPPKWAK